MFLELLLRGIFPNTCLGCKKKTKEDLAICEICLKKIPINSSLFCGICHARLLGYRKICHPNTPFILAPATNYRDNQIIQKTIRCFKFRHGDWIGKTIGKLTCEYAKSVLPQRNFLICPIPLGRRRLQKRGFNQAEVLAEIISKELNLPIANNGLVRIKETNPQTLLRGLKQRKENLENAFLADPQIVGNKDILLIDDVTTTGATLYSASKALKLSGAKTIFALVSAKAN